MVEDATVRVRQLARSRSEEVRFHRWLTNNNVTIDELMDHCGRRLRPLVAGRHVLAIQDTSELNYQKHAGRTKGLGTVGNGTDAGLFLHPVLAIDADDGACLGLVGAQMWLRTTGKAANYQSLPIEEKESVRWLIGAETAKRYLNKAARVTVVADRESDIYEEWARIPDHRTDLLTRACWDRCLAEGGKLFASVDEVPATFCYFLELPSVTGKRGARIAKMELRFRKVTINRSKTCNDAKAPDTVSLHFVDAREIADPNGPDQPVHWRLLTTHTVNSIETALQIVDWYRARWAIEQLFRTLKQQGLDVEASELESADALLRLTALAVQTATQCMQLVLARDGKTSHSAETVFDPELVPILAAAKSTLEGKTEKQRNPYPQGSLPWAAWIIARLGGWKGYRSERPPGPITMKNGMARFANIAQGWLLAKGFR